jgi:hypothetical protein
MTSKNNALTACMQDKGCQDQGHRIRGCRMVRGPGHGGQPEKNIKHHLRFQRDAGSNPFGESLPTSSRMW